MIAEKENRKYIGECGLLKGLSVDDWESYENTLDGLCDSLNNGDWNKEGTLVEYPSICFGLEILKREINATNPFELFPSDFTRNEIPIPINGLVWMGEKSFMLEQIRDKLEQSFNCIKLKIGAINFDEELSLLQYIRREFSADEIEIRVDANGAFTIDEAMVKLNRLSELDIHSIEQPIRQGQYETMAELCKKTPLPIALDEELIGVHTREEKKKMLEQINPQYIILKPSLIGGFKSSEEWIDLAEGMGIGWWATSALESNIGLNAISQWVYAKANPMPQGLGTGQLYTNNFQSPLMVENGHILYSRKGHWNLNGYL